MLNFPCEPLKAIDGLWVKHSGGKFGFSVQKELYLECGGVPDGKYRREAFSQFFKLSGWRKELRYNLESPRGHLPRLGTTVKSSFWGTTVTTKIFSLFSRIQTCKV